MRKLVLLSIYIFLGYIANGQVNVKDSSITTPMFYITYAYQFNGGDVAKRFNNNSAIGGGFQIKTLIS